MSNRLDLSAKPDRRRNPVLTIEAHDPDLPCFQTAADAVAAAKPATDHLDPMIRYADADRGARGPYRRRQIHSPKN